MKFKHLVVLALVVVACLLLAWWQWTRFRSGHGSFQNLGYALQWPVYAVVAVVFYRKTLRYEEDGGVDVELQPAETVDMPARPAIDVETFNAMNEPRRRRGGGDISAIEDLGREK